MATTTVAQRLTVARQASGDVPAAVPPTAPAGPAATTSKAMDQITRYIPSEIITLYVAWNTTDASDFVRRLVFLVFLAATPVAVLVTLAIKSKAAGVQTPSSRREWPRWHMCAATIAFAAWAYALPHSVFEKAIPAIPPSALLLTVTVVLGILGGLYEPEKPTS